MDMSELIQRIVSTVDKKYVQRNCKIMLKKLSFKSVNDLGNVTELAVWLYIYGLYDEALEVCDIIKDVPFTGNYTLWEAVDKALCIKARILREQGKIEESSEIIEYVNRYRHPNLYENGVQWFTETLEVNIASNLGTVNGRQWRLLKLETAIQYREAGKFPISDESLEMIIKDTIAILETEK